MDITYLFTPVQSTINPPIVTNTNELPFEQLIWEDFEKLCLAVVQLDFSINDCEIYGIKGQAQQGIDIFARHPNGRYNSYQCKRYKKFKLSDLSKAVKYFKAKDFYVKSETLHICTSCEWNETQVQDKFESLKEELKVDGIVLIKWDKIQLSRTLKYHPQIVFDFFGVEWVRRFNGDLAVSQISSRKKLDAIQVVKYRTELFKFYSTIFNIQDPGIPIKEINSPYSIQERFIFPEIISNINDENLEDISERENIISNSNLNQQQEYLYSEDYWYRNTYEDLRRKRDNIEEIISNNHVDIRTNIDEALLNSNKNIIVGDPGAGKSTLLRYLVLDILSSTPQLKNISRQYGKLLPVWLPFAFVTKHLYQNEALSISDILKLWFKSFDKEYLFDIAKDALNDERLFLVIDGIDEWNNISSAQQGITRIETIRGLYDCQVLYSSRPYGFRILKDFFVNLKVLRLASFSLSQQEEFAQKWFSKWILLQKNITDKEFPLKQSEQFIKELKQAGDLRTLAETPLLLSILIIQKMRDSILPRNKLDALKEITQYLINKHPIKRIIDAGLVQNDSADFDYKDIFCELAINIQKSSNDGVILKGEAECIIKDYLITYAEYDIAKAKLRSKELLNIGANSFGIIIEKSIEEVAFSHKLFQEFLSAQYLFESDEDTVNEFLIQNASNPTHHQVITNLFGLIPSKQIKKYKEFFNSLVQSKHETYQKDYLKLLAYEVAININTAPPDIYNSNFNSIIEDFKFETNLIFKESLLKRILEALNNLKLKDKVQEFLVQYFPCQTKYKDYRITALKFKDKLNIDEIIFLQLALINGTTAIQHDASNALKVHICEKEVFDFLKKTINGCSNPDILAFAINSIIIDKLERNVKDELIDIIQSKHPKVQFFIHKYKVSSKTHTEENLKELLKISNDLSYHFREEIIDLLIEGYNDSEQLKNILIKSLKREGQVDEGFSIDQEVAWKVLFHCFNYDSKVVQLIKEEFEKEDFPFMSVDVYNMFSHLVFYFKDNEVLMPVVENWLNKSISEDKHIGPENAFASIFVHSNKAKAYLLGDLPKSSVSHWNVMALLSGWKGDKEIVAILKDYFRNVDVNKTSVSANFISEVFKDEKREAIDILEKILFNPSLTFRERAIPALIEIDTEYFEKNVLQRLLEELDTFPKDIFSQYYTALDSIVKHYSLNPLVKEYVFQRMSSDINIQSFGIQIFPSFQDEYKLTYNHSLHLSKELRLIIIDFLNELYVLPEKIEKIFFDFDIEEEDEIKGDMALSLFRHLEKINPKKIIEISNSFIFGKGLNFELKRNIAFSGYLIAQKLSDYFKSNDLKHNSKRKASPVHIFSDHGYRRSNTTLMAKCLIEKFDYLISVMGKDFKPLLEDNTGSKNAEDIWSFFAKSSHRSSPSYPYIMEYINENYDKIDDYNLIVFLNRVSPNSSTLKAILLRLINSPSAKNKAYIGRLLGVNFKNDEQVYEEMKQIKDNSDYGKIIALCNGWPKEPILENIFQELIKDQSNINNYAGFHLKFLFRDVKNLMTFLNEVFLYPKELSRYRKYFFIPMIERLSRDRDFSDEIKRKLLTTTSVNEQISYYNLLTQINRVDDDLISWKSSISDFKDDYGYDIVSNKTVRLRDVLYDYYY